MTDNDRLERCFLPLDRRTPPAPCFIRVIGLDAGGITLSQLKRFYAQTKAGGVFLRGLNNPTEPETERFFSTLGEFASLNPDLIVRHMTIWLGQMKPAQRDILSKAAWETLELLRSQGSNPNVLKNAYVKFMCWFRAELGHVLPALGKPSPPKVLFEGDIAKHEAFLLRLLHRAGCDVLYVHYTSPKSYGKADPSGKFSELISGPVLTPPPGGLTGGASLKAPAARPSAPPPVRPAPPRANAPGTAPAPARPSPPGPAPWKGMEDAVELNAWVGDRPMWEAVLLSNGQRAASSGKLPTLFAACFGGDVREEYRNRLFQLKRDLDASGKKWLLITEPPPAPAAPETAPFLSVDKNLPRESLLRTLAERTVLNCGRVQALLAQRAVCEAMSVNPEQNPVRLYNHGVRLACWVRRYGELLFEGYRADKQPALVFYGPIKETEISLLWALAQMGVDILYFSPSLEEREKFSDHYLPALWRSVLFPDSLPQEPFPQREEKLRPSTTAYNASRELDQLLYSDTGMFRDRQFVRSQPVTLKTTYDEVAQLWKEPAQFRPSFETRDGVVYVPNLFSKICGVDKGDVDLYWDSLRDMMTESTYLAESVPFLKVRSPAMSAVQARSFLHGGKLDPKALKASGHYKYDYLPDDTQAYILEKIQALMDYDLITDAGAEMAASMLSVLMNLDKELLKLLQNFDFTREIPKFMVVDVTETMFSLEECILLAFLNLVGFDIAVFTPTGYRNLEKHLKPDSFDTLTAGDYRFDLTVPNLRERRTRSGGDFFSRLFGGNWTT